MKGHEIKSFLNNLLAGNERVIDLSTSLEEYLVSQKGYSSLEANDMCEEIIPKLINNFNKKVTEEKSLGLTHKYLLRLDENILIRHDVIQQSNPLVANVIRYKSNLYDLLKSLSWREFEVFCGIILKINGISDCIVTRGSKDGGVDAFGLFTLQNQSINRLCNDIKIKIISQAKHRQFGTSVSNADVSEFVTDILQLRNNNGFRLFPIPRDFLNSPYPLLPIFITNGTYEPDSIRTAQSHGIILWNGEQICEDFVKSEYLAEVLSGGNLDSTKLKRLISSS